MDKEISMQEIILDVSKNAGDIKVLTKNIEDLTRTVTLQASQTNKAIESLGAQIQTNVQELTGEISKQAIQNAGHGKLNWHTFAAICGVGVGILSLTVTVMVVLGQMALDPVRQNVNKIEQRQADMYLIIQNEMKDMEKRIQRESDYKHSNTLDRIKDLKEQLDKDKK